MQITYWHNTVSQKKQDRGHNTSSFGLSWYNYTTPVQTHKISAANWAVSYQLYEFLFQILDTKILKLPQFSLIHSMCNIH